MLRDFRAGVILHISVDSWRVLLRGYDFQVLIRGAVVHLDLGVHTLLHGCLVSDGIFHELLLVVITLGVDVWHVDLLGLVPWRGVGVVTFHLTVPVIRIRGHFLQFVKQNVLAGRLR